MAHFSLSLSLPSFLANTYKTDNNQYCLEQLNTWFSPHPLCPGLPAPDLVLIGASSYGKINNGVMEITAAACPLLCPTVGVRVLFVTNQW
jgi:hypothetical protein